MAILKQVILKGFKSIKDMHLKLRPLNVLIGVNGAGKSNFVSFFKMLHEMMAGRLQTYIGTTGRAHSLLYYGPRTTRQIEATLQFEVQNGVDTYYPGTQTYSAIYSSLQHGNASVRILARRIVPPVPHQLEATLKQLGTEFLANQLGLYLVPAFTYPPQQGQVIIGNLSDYAPRLGVMPGTVKFWRQYVGWPQVGTDGYFYPTAAAMVLYAINGDLFVTVDFTYWLPPPGSMVAPDIVERMFIASTVSFIH